MKDISEYGPEANERKAYTILIACLMAALKDSDSEGLTSLEVLDRAEHHLRRCLESELPDQSNLGATVKRLLVAARRALSQLGPDRDPSDLVSDLIH